MSNITGDLVAQGVWYSTISSIGIVENLLTALLIGTDGESRSPIYYYMINQCVADAVQLASIGVYQGLVLISPRVALVSREHPGISLWLLEVGMMEVSVFLLLISLDRFLTLRSPTPVGLDGFHGRRRPLWPWITLAWLLPPALHAATIFGHLVPLSFDSARSDWTYDSSQTVGRLFKYANLVYAGACILAVNLLNLVSFFSVRSVRRKVRDHTVSSTIRMSAEIKLFVQCAVTASITTAVVLFYSVLVPFGGESGSRAAIVAHSGWLLNHLHGPLIYLFMNARLRRRASRFLRCRCRPDQSISFILQTGPVRVDRVHSIVL